VVLQVDPSMQAACDDQSRLQGVERVARLLAIDSVVSLFPSVSDNLSRFGLWNKLQHNILESTNLCMNQKVKISYFL